MQDSGQWREGNRWCGINPVPRKPSPYNSSWDSPKAQSREWTEVAGLPASPLWAPPHKWLPVGWERDGKGPVSSPHLLFFPLQIEFNKDQLEGEEKPSPKPHCPIPNPGQTRCSLNYSPDLEPSHTSRLPPWFGPAVAHSALPSPST